MTQSKRAAERYCPGCDKYPMPKEWADLELALARRDALLQEVMARVGETDSGGFVTVAAGWREEILDRIESELERK